MKLSEAWISPIAWAYPYINRHATNTRPNIIIPGLIMPCIL